MLCQPVQRVGAELLVAATSAPALLDDESAPTLLDDESAPTLLDAESAPAAGGSGGLGTWVDS